MGKQIDRKMLGENLHKTIGGDQSPAIKESKYSISLVMVEAEDN